MEHSKAIQLESIDLDVEELLFPAHFINSLGGKENAKAALLNIIDRYFTSEYIDFEGLELDRCASGHRQDEDGRCECTNEDGK